MRYRMLLPAALLGAVCCSPTEPDPEPYTRSPEELITQITTSYNSVNIEDYADCFTSDFVFQLHTADHPDSTWQLPVEVACTEAIFAGADSISLEMDIESAEPWPGDSTAFKLTCPFSLEVYLDEFTGYRAQGDAVFKVVEIQDDVWSIEFWEDHSETKERTTWTGIKLAFSE